MHIFAYSLHTGVHITLHACWAPLRLHSARMTRFVDCFCERKCVCISVFKILQALRLGHRIWSQGYGVQFDVFYSFSFLTAASNWKEQKSRYMHGIECIHFIELWSVISGFDRPGITGLADFDSIWIARQYTIYLSVCPWCCMFTILHRWIRFSAFLDWPHPFWNGLVNRRYGGGDIRHVQHHYSHLCRSHHERLERFRERTEACFEKWTSWMTCIFCWSTFYQRPRGAEQKEILL